MRLPSTPSYGSTVIILLMGSAPAARAALPTSIGSADSPFQSPSSPLPCEHDAAELLSFGGTALSMTALRFALMPLASLRTVIASHATPDIGAARETSAHTIGLHDDEVLASTDSVTVLGYAVAWHLLICAALVVGSRIVWALTPPAHSSADYHIFAKVSPASLTLFCRPPRPLQKRTSLRAAHARARLSPPTASLRAAAHHSGVFATRVRPSPNRVDVAVAVDVANERRGDRELGGHQATLSRCQGKLARRVSTTSGHKPRLGAPPLVPAVNRSLANSLAR